MGADGERVPNTSPDDPFDTVQQKVSGEIDRFFKLELGRPEILNRIGENVIVFDFIRPDVGEEIFSMMVAAILERVERATGRSVTLSDSACQQLQAICLADLSDGGRGIRNQLEAHLVNPLARALFDQPTTGPTCVSAVRLSGGLTTLEFQAGEGI